MLASWPGRAGSCLESSQNWKRIRKCCIQNCSTTNIKDFIAFFGGPIWLRRKLSSLAIIHLEKMLPRLTEVDAQYLREIFLYAYHPSWKNASKTHTTCQTGCLFLFVILQRGSRFSTYWLKVGTSPKPPPSPPLQYFCDIREVSERSLIGPNNDKKRYPLGCPSVPWSL